MKKQSTAKVIFTLCKPGSRIIGGGFCPWRNYEKGVQGEGHFTMLPSSRIIGDGFCPWRNYEKGSKAKVIFTMCKPGSRIIGGWVLFWEKLVKGG